MNIHIEKELNEFEKYHKNIYNIYFHIFCGIIFMTFLFLLSKKYSYSLLTIYILLLLFTLNSFLITFIIFIILFIMIYIFQKYNISKTKIFIIFFIFYMLPELSHYLTKEPAMLNMNNITLFTGFVNIFYLLPFSIICLSNSI